MGERRFCNWLAVSASAVACSALSASVWGSTSQPPDLVLIHGTILTVDAADTVAQAVAIRDGRILAVGTDKTVLALAGKRTQVIDLQGRTATPGLIDTHAHIAESGLTELYNVDLSDVTNIADVVARVKTKVAQLKPGVWLQGEGWDKDKLAERRYIHAADLDAVAPNNPVWLSHITGTTGRYGVANSYALRLAKITGASRDPQVGTIDRDRLGAPTGVLQEAAMDAVTTLIPPATPEQRRKGVLKSIETLHREGMTAVKDPAIDQPIWDSYRELLDQGQLSVHVCVLWGAGNTVESARAALKHIEAEPKPPQSLGDGKLLSCGAKLFLDGGARSRKAWVYKEWNMNSTSIDAGNYGSLQTDSEIYRQQVRLFHSAGVNVGTHTLGDRAIDWVVDTYAQVLKEKPTHGLRHSIIHSHIPTDHAIEVMAALQKNYDAGYPEVQPTFMWWLGDTLAGNFGVERSQRVEPLKSFEAHGMQWGGGSDYSATPLAARYGLWASVQRESLQDTYGSHPFGTAESVDVHAALRSYTAWASRLLFLEDRIGSLEVGKEADIAVWDRNMYSIPPQELKNLHCQMTLFHGRVVYQANQTK